MHGPQRPAVRLSGKCQVENNAVGTYSAVSEHRGGQPSGAIGQYQLEHVHVLPDLDLHVANAALADKANALAVFRFRLANPANHVSAAHQRLVILLP